LFHSRRGRRDTNKKKGGGHEAGKTAKGKGDMAFFNLRWKQKGRDKTENAEHGSFGQEFQKQRNPGLNETQRGERAEKRQNLLLNTQVKGGGVGGEEKRKGNLDLAINNQTSCGSYKRKREGDDGTGITHIGAERKGGTRTIIN